MDRRSFFKLLILLYGTKATLIADDKKNFNFLRSIFGLDDEKEFIDEVEKLISQKNDLEKGVVIEENIAESPVEEDEKIVENSNELQKDIYLNEKDILVFQSIRKKLSDIQDYVGFGNFNLIGFDESLRIAKRSLNIGEFTKEELKFFEEMFDYDPSYHGFYGKRTVFRITDTINQKDVIKIDGTGHYLFKGTPFKTYNQMLKDVGDTLFLTSGVRSIVKQTKLYFDKINSVNGNLTIASRSLAPSAYTYHLVGDFDVGKKGLGYDNFTSKFSLTEEFKLLSKLNYIDIRYTLGNLDGVRYEPWHIKVL